MNTSTQRLVKADIQTYLKSRSNTETLNYHTVWHHVSQALGTGGIVGITTFHDLRYEQALEATERQGIEIRSLGNAFHVEPYDLLVIKCQRIMTQQGDIEAIGVRGRHVIPERLSLEETIKAIKDEGAIINVPNPFHQRGLGPYLKQHPERLEDIHALTVYSGEGAFWIPFLVPDGAKQDPNTQALEYYLAIKEECHHLGAVTASNSSNFKNIGTSYTNIRVPLIYETLQTSEDITSMLAKTLPETHPNAACQQPLQLAALRHQMLVVFDNNIPLVSQFVQKHSHLMEAHKEFEEVLKRKK